MAITRRDEVLGPIGSETTAVPRYDLVQADGTKVAEGVSLELKNDIVEQGTTFDKNYMDEVLAATGTTAGTATALTLAQANFVLKIGVKVRFMLHTSIPQGTNCTLNVNGTGNITLINAGGTIAEGLPALDNIRIYEAVLTSNQGTNYWSLIGVQNAVSKWRSPRTLSLEGDVAGSMSVDGSANAVATVRRKQVMAGTGLNEAGYWVRVAYMNRTGASNGNPCAIFAVRSTYNYAGNDIAIISVNCRHSTTAWVLTAGGTHFSILLSSSNVLASNFRLVYPSLSNTTPAEIWQYITTPSYNTAIWTVLQEGGRSTAENNNYPIVTWADSTINKGTTAPTGAAVITATGPTLSVPATDVIAVTDWNTSPATWFSSAGITPIIGAKYTVYSQSSAINNPTASVKLGTYLYFDALSGSLTLTGLEGNESGPQSSNLTRRYRNGEWLNWQQKNYALKLIGGTKNADDYITPGEYQTDNTWTNIPTNIQSPQGGILKVSANNLGLVEQEWTCTWIPGSSESNNDYFVTLKRVCKADGTWPRLTWNSVEYPRWITSTVYYFGGNGGGSVAPGIFWDGATGRYRLSRIWYVNGDIELNTAVSGSTGILSGTVVRAKFSAGSIDWTIIVREACMLKPSRGFTQMRIEVPVSPLLSPMVESFVVSSAEFVSKNPGVARFGYYNSTTNTNMATQVHYTYYNRTTKMLTLYIGFGWVDSLTFVSYGGTPPGAALPQTFQLGFSTPITYNWFLAGDDTAFPPNY